MQQEFKKEINKAEILVEALGYMQKYEGDIVVIKYGGSAMTNEIIKKSVLKDIAVLKSVGLKPIIVHGGGKDINRMLDRVQIKSEFKNGLRVTDRDTLEIAEMVLSGKINKGLVTHLEQIGTHAVGLSGKDGNMITVEKVMPQGEDIGFVGYTPIVSTIGLDEKYHAYNINADDVATAIARAVKASKLVFLTDIEGVLEDPNNSETLISKIDTESAKELFESGIITGGMIPKLKNCLEAVQNDVKRVHILDGRLEHSLLIEIFTKKGVGTMIKK
ncbi:MAG: acetylglutamate kinase [Coprobacillus sp. CAG:235_29_27]|nr:MAG: acetylglutamate kinase [Coprobacillus sp. CAG:235_29_27]